VGATASFSFFRQRSIGVEDPHEASVSRMMMHTMRGEGQDIKCWDEDGHGDPKREVYRDDARKTGARERRCLGGGSR
jgi:hypothetical protein